MTSGEGIWLGFHGHLLMEGTEVFDSRYLAQLAREAFLDYLFCSNQWVR